MEDEEVNEEEVLNEDAEDGEDDESDSSSEIEDKPVIETTQQKGKVFHLCPYKAATGCKFKSQKLNGLYGHIKFRHQTRGEFLSKTGQLIKKEPLTMSDPPKPKAPQKRKPTGSWTQGLKKVKAMPDDEDDANSPSDLGIKAEIKGKLRQLLKAIAQADPDKRDALMPEREVIMDYIKLLAKTNVSDKEISDIQSRYDDTLMPEVQKILGKPAVDRVTSGAESSSSTPPLSTKMSTLSRIAKLRGKVKQYLTSIAKLTPVKREDLMSERESLIMLNKRLTVTDIPPPDLDEMEELFDAEVRPAVDAAIQTIKKTPVVDKDGNETSDSMTTHIAQKKEELELARMDRMLVEEDSRRKQAMDAMRTSGSSGSGAMVPVMRPMVDDKTGQMKKDTDGKPLMETIYAPVEQGQGMNQLLMTLMLSGKLGGNDQNALLAMIMDNNTKLLTAMLNKNDGKSDKEIILEVQNQNMKMMMDFNGKMMEILKSKGEDPMQTQIREELRLSREEQSKTRDQMWQQQMTYMNREMEDLKRYAYRDDLETIQKQKERLESLGLVSSHQKDAETKALEESSKIAKEVVGKADKVLDNMNNLVQPFANAQAELMKSQINQQRPLRKAMNEKEKTSAYRQILKNIEGEEDEIENNEETE